MAQLEKAREGEYMQISTPVSNFPRDLLERFISVSHLPVKLEEPTIKDSDSAELELTLGLSSNGRFGVDPRAKKIKRTSSIPEFVNPVRDDDTAYLIPTPCAPLMRTCSLPTETEEEWRKRKELQTLRRMEARRKRTEKQRNSKAAAAAAVRERNRALSEDIIGEEDKRLEGVDEVNNQTEQGSATLNEFVCSRTTSLTRACLLGLNLNGEKDSGPSRASGLPPTPSSQGSSGSQGTGSSVISESQCQPPQGTKSVDARSPIGANSLLGGEQKPPIAIMKNHLDKLVSTESETKEIVSSMLEDMPCVSTKGKGPNGKRIEGFLYRYKKGEEVRIVCVCHGNFLTPAEFVKHAGGDDVAQPLKHIVVNANFL